MTQQEVFNMYRIQFSNKVMNFVTGKEISKFVDTSNGSLSRYYGTGVVLMK
jgi:hypothetical protein